MENDRHCCHCPYDIKYHFVWVAKYRRSVLTREVFRICEIEILQDSVSPDYLHVPASCPPNMPVGSLLVINDFQLEVPEPYFSLPT